MEEFFCFVLTFEADFADDLNFLLADGVSFSVLQYL